MLQKMFYVDGVLNDLNERNDLNEFLKSTFFAEYIGKMSRLEN